MCNSCVFSSIFFHRILLLWARELRIFLNFHRFLIMLFGVCFGLSMSSVFFGLSLSLSWVVSVLAGVNLGLVVFGGFSLVVVGVSGLMYDFPCDLAHQCSCMFQMHHQYLVLVVVV